jgi:hypothetical protein
MTRNFSNFSACVDGRTGSRESLPLRKENPRLKLEQTDWLERTQKEHRLGGRVARQVLSYEQEARVARKVRISEQEAILPGRCTFRIKKRSCT